MDNIQYFKHQRNEVFSFLPDDYKRVLDIGCGEGVFSAQLKNDSEKWGIELNSAASLEAAKKLYKVINKKFEDSLDQLPNKYFDLVICNDIIEHLPDHDHFFESIKQKITDDGCIIGSIPNVRYFENLAEVLLKKDWHYQDEGILDRTHLRFFTERSILRTFKEHGFRIEKFYGVNKARFFPLTIARIIKAILLYSIVMLTFGRYRDILYLQFGFRVRPGALSKP